MVRCCWLGGVVVARAGPQCWPFRKRRNSLVEGGSFQRASFGASTGLPDCYIAGYCVRRREDMTTRFIGLLKPMLAAVLMAGLLLVQPDFGAAVVIVCTALALLFVGGARFRDFFALSLMAATLLSLLAIAAPYRLKRLTGFWNPFEDPYGSGFSVGAVIDCDRPGRLVWCRSGQQRAETVLPAGGAYRFRLRGTHGRAWAFGRACDCGCVSTAGLARVEYSKRANEVQLPFQANLAAASAFG